MLVCFKWFVALSIIGIIIAAIFMPNLSFVSAASTGSERVNNFLKNVVGLDVEKYSVLVTSDIIDNPKDYPGIVRQAGKYTLKAPESEMYVLYEFHNQSLFSCLLRNVEGDPIYLQKPTNDLMTSVDLFLQRYELFEGYGRLEEQRLLLNSLNNVLSDSVNTIGDMKLSVSNDSDHVSFGWCYTINGVDYPGFGIAFQKNGEFGSLVNDRGTYKIGGTNVLVSKEEAISIAWGSAKNLTLPYKISESKVDAKLMTWPREPLTVYPCWEITFYLVMTKPEGPSHVVTLIYADTGKVIDCHPLTFGGSSLTEEETTNSSIPSTTSLNLKIDITYLIIIVIIVSCTIAVISLLIRKMHAKKL